MSQILHIINRELKVRLKSKGFYLFVLISPTLFLLPVIIGMFGSTNKTNKNLVGIKSDVTILKDTVSFRDLNFFQFKDNESIPSNKKIFGVLKINKSHLDSTHSRKKVVLNISEDDLYISNDKITLIQNFVNQRIISNLLNGSENVNLKETLQNNLKIVYPVISQNKNELAKKTARTLSFVLTMLMYVSFILFNNSILRSVVEEKSNKLAEVLSIFVSPKNLMAGKILGQGIAFLLQLILWIFVFLCYAKGLSYIEELLVGNSSANSYLQTTLGSIKNLPLIDLFVFIPLFFILGFLLNGTFNTILGVYSSGKNANYLMMIGNIVNLIAIYFGVFAAISPNSSITKFSYYVPFLNYLTIPTTLPFKLPFNTILTSLLILVGSTMILFYWSIKVYEKSLRQ